MANINTQTMPINLGGEVNINRSNNEIHNFEGFLANNGVIYDNSLHPLSSKLSDTQTIITKDGRRLEIRGNTLYSDDGKEVHSFTYPHFEITNVDVANKYATVDYYEDAENKIVLTSTQIIKNDETTELPVYVYQILSSYIDNEILIICYKDSGNNNNIFWTDYTTQKTAAIQFDTFVNKLIYNKQYNLISILEADYSKSYVGKIDEDQITPMTFTTELQNVMFPPVFVMENDLCASLKIFQNESNEVMVLDSVFRVAGIEDDAIKYDIAADNSVKSFSGFFALTGNNHPYYNNGFYSNSARLEKKENRINGYSTKENVTVKLEGSNTSISSFSVTGTIDESGAMAFNPVTALTNHFKNKMALWEKDNLPCYDLTVGWNESTLWTASGSGRHRVYPYSWSYRRAGPGTQNGFFNVKIPVQTFDGNIIINTPKTNRQEKTITINDTEIAKFPVTDDKLTIPIKIKTQEYFRDKLSFTTTKLDKKVDVYKDARVLVDESKLYAVSDPGKVYATWKECYSLEWGNEGKLLVDFTTGLTITINDVDYELDSNFILKVDDVEWTFADIFQNLKIAFTIDITATTYNGYVLSKRTPDNFLSWVESVTGVGNQLRPTIRKLWTGQMWNSSYYIQVSRGYNMTPFMTANTDLMPKVGITLNKSMTGLHVKPVNSTAVETYVEITDPIFLSLENFNNSDTTTVLYVGAGCSLDGKTWQYGKTFSKGAYQLIYNNDTLSGLSYGINNMIGTLLVPWFSLDEDFNIKTYGNTIIYKDTLGKIKRISLVEDDQLHWDIALDRYLIVNTADYINCIDLDTMTLAHYGSDYNGRLRPVGMESLDDLLVRENNVYFATGVNANYEITGGVPAMIRNPIMSETICGDLSKYNYENCGQINDSIDIYIAKNGATTPIYDKSAKIFSPFVSSTYTKADMIGVFFPIDTTGNMILNPSLLTKYTKSYFKNFMMIMEGRSYIGITQGINDYLLYYLASEFEGLENLFNIQGIAYGVTNDKIYRITISNGVLVDYDVVCKISGLQYCGAVINEAYFYSKINNSIYSFTGDNTLQIKTMGSDIRQVYNSFYNTSTQDLYLETDIGLIVFSLTNNYVLPEINGISLKEGLIKEIFFPNDSQYILTLKDTRTLDIAYDNDSPEYIREPLILTTNFYGTTRNMKNKIQCWNISLNKKGDGKGKITLRAETLTNKGMLSNKKTINISRLDWDKQTDTYYVRFQPQLQTGAGCRLYLESDFPINQLSCDIMGDSKQISTINI